METPSVTDWLNTAFAGAALLLSSISLIWQWKTARPKRPETIRIRTEAHGADVWELKIKVEHVSHAAGLYCTVKAITPGAGVFPADSVPWISGDLGGALIASPWQDWTVAKEFKGTTQLSSPMEHASDKAEASVIFGITWPEGAPHFGEIEVGLTDGNTAFPFKRQRFRVRPTR